MPSFPGLSASMPSKVHLEDEPFIWDNFFPSNFLDEIDNSFFVGDELFNTLEFEPSPYEDGQLENGASATLTLPNEIKRDCLLGKPEDQCLRECGAECDPFKYVVRHCACGSNMAIAHNCHCDESLRLVVNPQISLPYSPYNDHCYYQTIGHPNSNSDAKQTSSDSFESESMTDDDSSAEEENDDEIDVVTITDIKVEPPKANTVKRRGRKPAPKLKFSNAKSVASNRRTSGVKKKGRSFQQIPVKRLRRPKLHSEEPSSRSSSDVEELGKRSNHNNMERLRRNDQKNMLQKLRILVPSIKENPKAPKVLILNEAADYVRKLVQQRSDNEIVIRTEEQKQVILQRRLDELKREMGRQ